MFLMLIKRHLWLYLLEKHFFESSYELMKSLEINNRIVLFFDRAILASTIGYERRACQICEVELREPVEQVLQEEVSPAAQGGFLL